ncbi:MAG: hypothetical protein ACLGI6_24105, partial [Gammaproteobacteria bacterium]
MSETAYEVGAVLGTAVLGSVFAAVYARALDVPSSVGPVFATEARETLGGAVALAGRIGGVEGQRLLDAATAAFAHGSAVASTVAVVALAGVAATVVVGLRRRLGHLDLGRVVRLHVRAGLAAAVAGGAGWALVLAVGALPDDAADVTVVAGMLRAGLLCAGV